MGSEVEIITLSFYTLLLLWTSNNIAISNSDIEEPYEISNLLFNSGTSLEKLPLL